MGILDVLLHLEKMGVLDLFRTGRGKIAYLLNEQGMDERGLTKLMIRVERFMKPHKPLLLRWLRPMPEVVTFTINI